MLLDKNSKSSCGRYVLYRYSRCFAIKNIQCLVTLFSQYINSRSSAYAIRTVIWYDMIGYEGMNHQKSWCSCIFAALAEVGTVRRHVAVYRNLLSAKGLLWFVPGKGCHTRGCTKRSAFIMNHDYIYKTMKQFQAVILRGLIGSSVSGTWSWATVRVSCGNHLGNEFFFLPLEMCKCVCVCVCVCVCALQLRGVFPLPQHALTWLPQHYTSIYFPSSSLVPGKNWKVRKLWASTQLFISFFWCCRPRKLCLSFRCPVPSESGWFRRWPDPRGEEDKNHAVWWIFPSQGEKYGSSINIPSPLEGHQEKAGAMLRGTVKTWK